ncbi:hypothetical protein FQR65_LT02978 [Abscondita terminalis]|nr:hypothetical protein FQR65_LT02978 [Abscondita terminalis]
MNFAVINVWTLLIVMQLAYGNEYDCPGVCTCEVSDASTNCAHNGLTVLPHGIYPKIVQLDLSFNNFNKVPQNISNYKTLQYLNMSRNKLSHLKERSLGTLDSLKILDLSHNLFKDWLDINNASLINLPSLSELNLSHNPLKGFSDIFVDHPLRSSSLEKLVLINCSITSILDNVLLGFPNLKSLYLSDNPLLAINAQMKSNSLVYLDLSSCGLQRLHPEALTQLNALQSLTLSKNYQLKKFNSKSSSLKLLDLSYCNLESVPTIHMPNITTLIFKENHLRQILSKNFDYYPKLTSLDLSSNAIHTLELDAFRGLKFLYSVDLSYNILREIPLNAFHTNVKLQFLNLSRNYLSTVNQIVSESLRVLDMSVCEIREISKNSLIRMPRLEVLNLSRNLLTYIPNKLRGDELRVLDVSGCGIYALNNLTFSLLKRLRKLNLAGNRLTSGIKPSFFYAVTELHLEDNSWLCDCNSAEFLELYVWLHHSVTTQNVLRCRSPENMAGYTWEVSCESVWLTTDVGKEKGGWIYSVIVVGLMVLLCCLVMALKHVHHRKASRTREEQERDRHLARERLREIHERNLQYSRESINRNAPDPREMQTPPSYMEAISMPRLNISCNSLAGSHRSLHSLESNVDAPRRKKLRKKRPRNRHGSKSNIADTGSAATLSRGNSAPSNSEDELRPNTQERNVVTESSF